MSRRIAVAGCLSLAAAIVLSVMPAPAQTLYFGGEGGWTLLQDQQIKPAGLRSGTERFSSGFAVGRGSVTRRVRGGSKRNTPTAATGADSITIGGANLRRAQRQPPGERVSGQPDLRIRSRLAGEAAYRRRRRRGLTIEGPARPRLGTFFDDNKWEIGYQAIGGLRYDVTPNIAIDLDYRYFATTEATFLLPGSNIAYKTGYDSHNVMASVVYRLGPPAPPPPIAAPPPPRAAAGRRTARVPGLLRLGQVHDHV